MLPEQINILAIQPLIHSSIHILESLVVGIWQIIQDLVAKSVLSISQVLVTIGVLLELLLWNLGKLSIDSDDLVLLVEELDPLRLPLAVFDESEEDKSAVTFYIDWDTMETESLCDGGLHLADASLCFQVDVGECAIFSVHDEVAVGSTFYRYFDEFLDCETTGPSCMMLDTGFNCSNAMLTCEYMCSLLCE